MVITSRMSSDGQNDAARSTPGAVGSQQGQDQFGRYPPWGFDYRVPNGARAICVAPEGGSQICSVGCRHDDYPPDFDDDKWTTTMHNEVAGTWVKLRSDGGVQVGGKGSLFELKSDGTAKLTNRSGASVEMKAGGVISFNGGQLPVNRSGDRVDRTADMKTWMTQVEGYINGLAHGAVAPLTSEVIGATIDGNSSVQA
jgi:hypothetical protein